MIRRPLTAATLLVCLGGATPALAADPPVEFTNTGVNCRNLLVQTEVDPAVVREFVPERFEVGDEPTGFVELASCESGELDGKPLGAFKLAEAAVNIEQPAPVPGSEGTTAGDIYALSQLDTNPELSARKRGVGFASDLVDIQLEPSDPLATQLEASIPWSFSPYTMSADVTPQGAPIPGATIVTRIWGLGSRGLVVTHNDIQTIRSGSAGVGTATFRAGSPLARLFGGTEVTGASISGIGDFVNTTRIIEPAAAAAAPTPSKAKSRVRARVTAERRLVITSEAKGRLVATVRRGTRPTAPLVRTLRGTNRLTWRGFDRAGRRVRPGTYTVRIRRAAGGPLLRKLRLTVKAAGPRRVR